MHCDKVNETFFPELARENVHELASEQSWVHFITMRDMLRYEFNNFITTPFRGFEGFQNYNLIKINTKHAGYKTGSRKKIILSAQCHRAFNTCASKNFRLAQGSLTIRFWIERKPYVKRYFNANYVIFIHWEQCNSIQNLIAKLPIKIELPSLQCK